MQGTKTASADIILFKGLIQTVVYSFLVRFGGGGSEGENQPELKILPTPWKDRLCCVAYAVVCALRFAAQFAGVLFLPMAGKVLI